MKEIELNQNTSIYVISAIGAFGIAAMGVWFFIFIEPSDQHFISPFCFVMAIVIGLMRPGERKAVFENNTIKFITKNIFTGEKEQDINLSEVVTLGFVKAIVPAGRAAAVIQYFAFILNDHSIIQIQISGIQKEVVKQVIKVIKEKAPSIGISPDIQVYLNS